MKRIAALLALALLAGCSSQETPDSAKLLKTDNPSVEAWQVATIDGCTLYWVRYFSRVSQFLRCPGPPAVAECHQESSGKTTKSVCTTVERAP